MADRKPPVVCAGERETLLALLQFQRESFVRKVVDIDDAAAASSPVPSGTSLLWLANHLADAERIWLLHRFTGAAPGDDPPAAPTLAAAVDRYRGTWAASDAVIAASTLDETCRAFDHEPPVSLRWIVAHLLEETARHAGHADILRELVDGRTGR